MVQLQVPMRMQVDEESGRHEGTQTCCFILRKVTTSSYLYAEERYECCTKTMVPG